MSGKLLLAALVMAVFVPGLIFAQEQTQPAPAPAPAASLNIETQICSGIQDRMPTGTAESFPPEVGQVYLWCRVTGATDPATTIKHVWSYNGKEMGTVELPVKSPAWRTWSSKKIAPESTGDWNVKILDASGNVLKDLSFKVGAAEPKQ